MSAPANPERAVEHVVVRTLTLADAQEVARWRYAGPWSIYDGNESQMISAELGYHAISEAATGILLGFFCLGADARVPALAEKPGVLDFGVGLDPAIVGRGRGTSLVRPVLDWVARRSDAQRLRAVVQAWNERSLRFCAALGFEEVGRHAAPQDGGIVDYVLLERPLHPRPAP